MVSVLNQPHCLLTLRAGEEIPSCVSDRDEQQLCCRAPLLAIDQQQLFSGWVSVPVSIQDDLTDPMLFICVRFRYIVPPRLGQINIHTRAIIRALLDCAAHAPAIRALEQWND